MKIQNLKFGEAVKHLAQLAGMQPYMFSKQDEEREKKWKEYQSIFSQYVDFYHNELLKKFGFFSMYPILNFFTSSLVSNLFFK